jgi:site-specific recombinase XerD
MQQQEIQTLEAYVKENYSPKSVPGYLTTIKKYTTYMQAKALMATYSEVLTYIGHLRKLQLHPKTLVNNLFSIKIYYQWLIVTAQRSDHPCKHLYLKDRLNKRIPVESLYSKKTLDELLANHINTNPVFQKRDEIVISLLIYQAMTIQEITALNLSDVNLQQATIQAKGGYSQNPRTLCLQASQILLLHEYIHNDRMNLLKQKNNKAEIALILNYTGNRLQGCSIKEIVNYKKSKQERLSPLKIRQSVIAHLLKRGNDLRVVQVFAGHRRVSSTEEYKQTGLEELKTMIEKLHPLENK